MPKKAYIVELPGLTEEAAPREVVLVQLGVSEFQQSMSLVGNIESDDARSFAEGIEGLRLSVRKIDGKEVTREDLQGRLWDDHFDMIETSLLAQQFSKIHAPAKGVVAGLRPAAGNVSGG